MSPLPNLNLETFAQNPLASQLGIRTTTDNILQFYNRFSENNLLQERPLSTVLAKPYYFTCIWSFVPKEVVSKVEKMLTVSMKESNTESLKYFIQSVDLPDIESYSTVDPIPNEFGMVSNAGIFVKPSSNQFTINFLSTEFSLHEHVFYYWLREATSNEWVYDERPFTKAKLQVTFLDSRTRKHMFSYVLTNVFPASISTLKPSHAGESIVTRPVVFNFDNIYVLPASKLEHGRLEKAFDKFLGDRTGRALSTGINKKLPKINI